MSARLNSRWGLVNVHDEGEHHATCVHDLTRAFQWRWEKTGTPLLEATAAKLATL